MNINKPIVKGYFKGIKRRAQKKRERENKRGSAPRVVSNLLETMFAQRVYNIPNVLDVFERDDILYIRCEGDKSHLAINMNTLECLAVNVKHQPETTITSRGMIIVLRLAGFIMENDGKPLARTYKATRKQRTNRQYKREKRRWDNDIGFWRSDCNGNGVDEAQEA